MAVNLKVPQCSQCPKDADYYCKTCKRDLCLLCKEIHFIDSGRKVHHVVIYRLKFGDFMILDSCEKHPEMNCDRWCLSCQIPICDKCSEHKECSSSDIIKRYKKRKRYRYYRKHSNMTKFLLRNSRLILSAITSCKNFLPSEFVKFQSKKKTNAQTLRNLLQCLIEEGSGGKKQALLKEVNDYVKRQLQEKHRKMYGYIAFLQKTVNSYEQSANKPIQYLLKVNKKCADAARYIYDTSKKPSLSLEEFFISDCLEIGISKMHFMVK